MSNPTSHSEAREAIRIGGAAGYWGESDMALPQFLEQGGLDYIVFDYLAEITMSILARAKSANPELGYATDFVTAVVKPYAAAISASGARLISNAGGLNPEACAAAIRAVAEEAGVELRVAVVVGDDLMPHLRESVHADAKEMFSGEPLPPRETIASANAYLGAFPIAQALATDADIILTGRCVDSAVTLGACIHAFGWTSQDLDLLAAGSLVGHLLECGPQVTGGNYTDWETVADGLWDVGYPIAEVRADGTAIITKPEGRGGAVTLGTVGEQLLYEIGDPTEYVLPDVVCDFSQVTLTTVSKDAVAVSGARGRGIPTDYKLSMTWMDGWRAGTVFFYAGQNAAKKARLFAASALRRARARLEAMGLGDYDEVCVEVVGDESQYGAHAQVVQPRELAIKVACRHQQKAAVALLMRELTGVALAAPAGLFSFAGTRPKPSPVVRLFSTLVPKDAVETTVITDAGDAAPVIVEPG
ncbi:MAG: acyclic terpene utilization AtuA family protein, partial [Halieaceae bacterium]|nr:acyclic terpene utilization AtuA family protein [Halieaceae bacterium]